jgi:hypothetical protein
MARHKRKAIPLAVKVAACERLHFYGFPWPAKLTLKDKLAAYLREMGFQSDAEIQWDHDPPLELRPDNEDGTDYDPPQLDPRHIFPMLAIDHKAKTTGRRGESKLSISGNGDKSRIDKVRRLRGELKPKHKRAWPKRKLESRPFNKPR